MKNVLAAVLIVIGLSAVGVSFGDVSFSDSGLGKICHESVCS